MRLSFSCVLLLNQFVIIHYSILTPDHDACVAMKPFVQTYLRALTVHGSDACAFIQSQVTLDLESSQTSRFYPAAWCDAKGRAICVMLIAGRQDHVMVVLPESQAETVLGRLQMFSIGRDVKLSGPQTIQACIQRDNSEAALDSEWYQLSYDTERSIRIKTTTLSHEQESKATDPSLDQQWITADLAYGFPWLAAETSGLFIPQMLGLEALEGLSYHKGCYPGQEVIARVHYRGKVTRKTMGFEIIGGEAVEPGIEFKLGDQKAVVLYSIKQLAKTGATLVSGLAVVPTVIESGQTFSWNSLQGRMIERQA